jgi:hypothetical protein
VGLSQREWERRRDGGREKEKERERERERDSSSGQQGQFQLHPSTLGLVLAWLSTVSRETLPEKENPGDWQEEGREGGREEEEREGERGMEGGKEEGWKERIILGKRPKVLIFGFGKHVLLVGFT